MNNKDTLYKIKQIKNLIDDLFAELIELEDMYINDIEELQQVIDKKTDLLDKYVSEADANDEI